MGRKREAILQKSKEAFHQVLRLNPDLSLAHILYTYLEADRGRAQQAMQRLLAARAAVRQ
jgi:hypothetical protein